LLSAQFFPEQFPRLKRGIPPWKDNLFDMFKDCLIDWSKMFATDSSVPSEGDPITPNNTLGGRKRTSSGATESTATCPSKKARQGKATQSTADSPSKKSIGGNTGSTRKEKMKVTSLIQKLIVDLDTADAVPQQIVDKALQLKKDEDQATKDEIKRCLDLAVGSGISKSSPKFFFLTKLFRDKYWRIVFLYFNTDEERLQWILHAYADPKMLQ